MHQKKQKHKSASVKRHQISRPDLIEDVTDFRAKERYLRLAEIALDGPGGAPFAEQNLEHDGLVWDDGHWSNSAELRRHARALLHYRQE